MDIESLTKHLNRARILIENDKNIKTSRDSKQELVDDSIDKIEEAFNRKKETIKENLDYSNNINNPGLPKEIFESMMKNHINVDSESQLDKAIDSAVKINNKIYEDKSKNITENKNVNINYNIIRNIVEESVNKILPYIKEEISKQCKENLMEGIRINNGKIQILCENGDLYAAKMKLIKNIKKTI